eukprot:9331698-Ditylum_brightwellii.AAC.1
MEEIFKEVLCPGNKKRAQITLPDSTTPILGGIDNKNTVHSKGLLLLIVTRQGTQASPWLLQHLQSHNWLGHMVPNYTSVMH